MVIFSFLYNVIIAPIETIIEATFCFEYNIIGFLGAGGAIIAVSLVMNFLALPLYNIADAIQEKERDIQKSLAPDISHIKKSFKGDEQYMLISTLYREKHYHPLYALRSSLSILLEIPFFIAAYHYLSHCQTLTGNSFAFLNNLGSPDGLLTLGSIHINLLPIVMTLINIASAAVYLKGFPLREKIQTYALAAIFLVLLYNSPSGLVFYWILNNLFSLAKNVVTKYFSRPGAVVHIVITAVLIFCAIYILAFGDIHNKVYRTLAVVTPAIVALAPLVIKTITKKIKGSTPFLTKALTASGGPSRSIFFLFLTSCVGLTLLCGLTLSSAAIATSPVEFSFIGETSNPLSYIYHNLSLFLGAFLFWPLVIYKMFGGRVSRCLPYIFSFLFIMAVFDILLFRYDYGMMDIYFKLDDPTVLKNYSSFWTVGFFFVAVAVALFLLFIKRFKAERHLTLLVLAICAAQLSLSFLNIKKINTKFNEYVAMNGKSAALGSEDKIKPIYHLSKTKKNVVVFFLDSAISTFFPLILEQFPELSSSFDGFTYFPNTISFGTFTLMGSPAMCGGYEYTIDAMNARSDELLRDKHNEAITLMPRLFSSAGWRVTVTDPPFSNYAWSGDKTPFALFPNIDVSFIYKNYYAQYISAIKGSGGEDFPAPDSITQKHSAGFVFMESAPPVLRSALYASGKYLVTATQNRSVAQFSHLYFLGDLTDNTSDKDSFVFLCNDLPHEPALMAEPDYVPALNVDEKSATTGLYKARNTGDKECYQVNAAAIRQFAKYLNKLREMEIYDNTRIILVGDHGRGVSSPNEDRLSSKYMPFNPLLLYKDFDCKGPLSTDNRFMTNGDTLFLAKDGLKLSDKNPATGKLLTQEKTTNNLYRITVTAKLKNAEMQDERTWRLSGGTVFSVHDDIFNPGNWSEKEVP